MAYKYYDGPSEFRPMNAWAYVGYTILFAIPIIGWIFLIVFTFNSSNYNRRAFARSYWCWLLLAVIIFAVLIATGVGGTWIAKYFPGKAPQETMTTTQEQMEKTTAKLTEKHTAQSTAQTSDSSFRKTMDSYEAFIDEYVDFMKNYDPTDVSQLSDYTNLISRYTEYMTSIAQIEEEELSEDDLAYYLEVNARVVRKLATIED